MEHYPEPPSSAEQLDALMQQIDLGRGSFAALSVEQRA